MTVIAAFGTIVDPHGRHPQAFRRGEVLRHILDHHGLGGVDPKLVDEQAVSVGRRLGDQFGGVNVVQMLEMARNPDPVEHSVGIRRIAIGEQEFASGEPAQPCIKQGIGRDPIEIDIMDIGEKMVRVDIVMLHQSGQGGAMLVEMLFLDPPRFDAIARQQALDISDIVARLARINASSNGKVLLGIRRLENCFSSKGLGVSGK